jgi:integrase
MPRLTRKLPSLRHHKPSGQAVVTLAGRDIYLGSWGSPESRVEYERVIGEWLVSRQAPQKAPDSKTSPDPTVSEILIAFWKHAEQHYRDSDGHPAEEQKNLKDALRPVKRLYGKTSARAFGPLALRAIRDDMVRSGRLARGTINARIQRIRRVFKWAASMELVPGSVVESLRTVDGLREGRTNAREAPPIQPVAIEQIETTLPHMPRPVAAMVLLQLLTGCRVGEVLAIRGCDLVTSGHEWEYRPGRHKTRYRGKVRAIPLGTKATEIVREFLGKDLNACLFRPRSNDPRHRERYDRRSFRQAIVRAARRAGVPDWSPLQPRHTAATAIRASFGLEAAQVVLGHAKADVTQVYVERDLAKAREVMREIG